MPSAPLYTYLHCMSESGAVLERDGVRIVDTFAEAFGMRAARVVITAQSPAWARTAAQSLTGFATSVIGCKVEAGIEAELDADATPDLRPGVSVLLFGFDADGLQRQLVDRVGQTVLTCPTTACFDGLPEAPERVTVGGQLRHFGDRFQSSKVLADSGYWRIPVMEGEFLVQEAFGIQKAIGGGNLLILAAEQRAGLAAAEAAVDAMRKLRGIILPFPGGIVRAGSKVGAKKYKNMMASTNDAYCPTLRGRNGVDSQLPEGVNSVLEIVVDGLIVPRSRARFGPAWLRRAGRVSSRSPRGTTAASSVSTTSTCTRCSRRGGSSKTARR